MKLNKWLKLINFFSRMESFYCINSRKTLKELASITEGICQMCDAKWESTESKSFSRFFYFPCQKKVKEALRTRLSRNKITWTETFVRSKKFAKWKTILNREILACYENLPIKPTLKKRAIFFVCNRNSPFHQISRFRSLHRLSSNNLENTTHRHFPLTGTKHCNSRLSENIHF